ncbi:pyrimidine 5'-nucleotidase (UMPH-1) domain-containing protein [Phthorimaea operculella]|nr:pyrimidine 5'-nucleotidase (UMPH-1) domain-containing protein [Phthorimaea operculella]
MTCKATHGGGDGGGFAPQGAPPQPPAVEKTYLTQIRHSRLDVTAMKPVSKISEIPEFDKPNVHIRDEQELLRKINKITADGHTKLQIVTDFDHTMTRHTMDNGVPVLTSFGMFRECPSTPQHYKDEDTRLSAIYKPIEADPVMPLDVKIQHMIDWYVQAHKILKNITFPRNELTEIAKKMVNCFRQGVSDLISWSVKQQVPVLVFSAGLGECVTAALKAADFLLPNVKVCPLSTAGQLEREAAGASAGVLSRTRGIQGVSDLISWSVKQQVPVLVFSAGLGESVTAALKAADFLLPNVKVCPLSTAGQLEREAAGASAGVLRRARGVRHCSA